VCLTGRRVTVNMPPMRAPANGIELEYETFGDPEDPPLLLVMGLGAQMIWIHPDFCQDLVDRGFFVIRFDNRDIGLSTRITDHHIDVLASITGLLQGDDVEAPYTLLDMAADAWGLCDHLGLDRVHLFGVSLGGMIVQQMAIGSPQRVASLTSLMSTTGDPDVGQPTPDALAALIAPAPSEREAYLEQALVNGRILAGDEHIDEDWILERNGLAFDRGLNPDGSAAQLLALLVSPSRSAGLRSLDVPALVIHGEIDPLITISGGERTAECLQGSEFLRLEGMGHDLPRYYWAPVIHHVVALAARSAV
jgi:pimeloyl-ACP methyl ester carboxylesterase